MDIKSVVETLGIVAGIILTAQIISTNMKLPRASEVDNIPIQAPTNYLQRRDVQAKLANITPYRNYTTWQRGSGGL